MEEAPIPAVPTQPAPPEEEEPAGAGAGATVAADLTAEASSPETDPFATPVNAGPAKRSRGNGPGRSVTKQMAALIEHRSKKLKAIEELTKVQQERHKVTKQFVDNQATFQAFMMAKAGLDANRDSPLWSKFYRDKMNELMGPQFDSDSSSEEEN